MKTERQDDSMRTLEFVVTGQTLEQKPDCDFSGLVSGSDGYIYAKFYFSEDWSGCSKTVEFSSGNHDYPSQMLNRSDECKIPQEALARTIFRIQVIGKKSNLKLTTNRLLVTQRR